MVMSSLEAMLEKEKRIKIDNPIDLNRLDMETSCNIYMLIYTHV
jgi:hypothetical protein